MTVDSGNPSARWTLGWVVKSIWGVVIAGIGTAIALLTYQLATTQDVRERTFRFHELVLVADDLYCQSRADGLSSRIMIYIDRAAKLEPDIRDELVAMDYICLASVGSHFWPTERATAYGLQALRIGESNGNRLEMYASNLVLGHIAFLKFRQSRSPQDLSEGRDRFKKAEGFINIDESPLNLQYSEQLYELWAEAELYAGNTSESSEIYNRAQVAGKKLGRDKSSIYSVILSQANIRNGHPPRLPCPSTIIAAPALLQNPSLKEAQFKAPPGIRPEEATTPPTESDSIDHLSERVGGVEKAVDSLGKEIQQEISDLKKQLENPKPSAAPDPEPEQADDQSLSNNGGFAPIPPLPPAEAPQTPPCLVKIYNNTLGDVRLKINGFVNDAFTIPPKTLRSFHVGYEKLELERLDNGNYISWDPSIFQSYDGGPAEPVVEITPCCIQLRTIDKVQLK